MHPAIRADDIMQAMSCVRHALTVRQLVELVRIANSGVQVSNAQVRSQLQQLVASAQVIQMNRDDATRYGRTDRTITKTVWFYLRAVDRAWWDAGRPERDSLPESADDPVADVSAADAAIAAIKAAHEALGVRLDVLAADVRETAAELQQRLRHAMPLPLGYLDAAREGLTWLHEFADGLDRTRDTIDMGASIAQPPAPRPPVLTVPAEAVKEVERLRQSQFDTALHCRWETMVPADQRPRYPLGEYQTWPGFLATIDRDGVRVQTVLAAVVYILSRCPMPVPPVDEQRQFLYTTAAGLPLSVEGVRATILHPAAPETSLRVVWWRNPQGVVELIEVAASSQFRLLPEQHLGYGNSAEGGIESSVTM